MRHYDNGVPWVYEAKPKPGEAEQKAFEAYDGPRLLYGALPDDEVPFYPRTPGERAVARLAAKDPREKERRRHLKR